MKGTMKITMLVAGLLLIATSTLAEVLAGEDDCKQLAERVMKSVGSGDLKSAFEKMKAYVTVPEAEYESTSLQTKAQREQFAERLGRPEGYEFIGTKKIGASLLRISYIEKTDKNALPWRFFFYRTSKGWLLNNFFWKGDLQDLFCE